MTRTSVVVIALVSAGIGGLVGARLEEHRRAADAKVTLALRAVETAGLCAASLRALDEGRADKQRLILEDQMGWSMEAAERDLEGIREPKFGIAIPNLIEGVRRARQYAEGKGKRDLVERCDRVLAGLQRGARA